MLRLLSTLVLGIALGYCMFFVRLEGRPLSSHVADIWRSPVVQQKVKLVEREIPRALRGKVPLQAPSAARQRRHAAPAPKDEAGEPATSAHDRRALEALVHRAHEGKKAPTRR